MGRHSSYSCTRKLATIQCLVLLQPHHFSIPYPLSFASFDTHGDEMLSPCGSQFATTTGAGTGNAMI